MFEDFLKKKHAEQYYGLDDNMPDAFEYWLSNLDVDDLIKFADAAIGFYAGKTLGSIKSDKKAKSSAENGKKGGRPKLMRIEPSDFQDTSNK